MRRGPTEVWTRLGTHGVPVRAAQATGKSATAWVQLQLHSGAAAATCKWDNTARRRQRPVATTHDRLMAVGTCACPPLSQFQLFKNISTAHYLATCTNFAARLGSLPSKIMTESLPLLPSVLSLSILLQTLSALVAGIANREPTNCAERRRRASSSIGESRDSEECESAVLLLC